MKDRSDHQPTLDCHRRVRVRRPASAGFLRRVPLLDVVFLKPYRQRPTLHQRRVVLAPVPYPIALLSLVHDPLYGGRPAFMQQALQCLPKDCFGSIKGLSELIGQPAIGRVWDVYTGHQNLYDYEQHEPSHVVHPRAVTYCPQKTKAQYHRPVALQGYPLIRLTFYR